MDYAQALKFVEKDSKVSNYLSINFGYSLTVLMPYKEGLALLDSLNSAEKSEDSYSNNTHIRSLTKDDVRVTILSQTDYRQRKLATLLNVKVEDLEALANPVLASANTE